MQSVLVKQIYMEGCQLRFFYIFITKFIQRRKFVLMLYVPVNKFSVMLGCFPVFLGRTSTKQRIKVSCSRTQHSASSQS